MAWRYWGAVGGWILANGIMRLATHGTWTADGIDHLGVLLVAGGAALVGAAWSRP